MFQLKALLYYATIAIVLNASPSGSEDPGRFVCRLQDPPNQCGEFCLTALMPLIDHISKHQEQWKTCNLDNNLTKAKLEEIQGRQTDIRKQIESQETSLTKAWKKIIAEDIGNRINGVESKQLKMEGQLSGIQEALTSIQNDLRRLRISQRFKLIGSRYLYIENNVKANWTTALSACKQMGGSLASILNKDDFDAIVSQLNESESYKIGINDQAAKYDFISVSSGKKAPFLKWKPGEPRYNHEDQRCVTIHNGGMWVDGCTAEHKFICEADDNTL
ncbi:accessory gland protein Acp29AB [Drosophila teissieri]|uniref:accessory gland protein Acp29AB n=1 Tax=Drosophila teissieri TaxID=7243 RepID=UPI001CBA4463|nr:accessory gland protein Acp29AB [Drosophila teissieri]